MSPDGARGLAEARAPPGGNLDAVYADVESYYAAKVARYGATPQGVDWSCQPTQSLRFVQLLRLCDFSAPFSLNDVGCGYGALVSYLSAHHPGAAIDYLGTDLSPAMIRRARRLCRGHPGRRFAVSHDCPRIADYAVASGVMNVKLDHPPDVWEAFVAATLRDMHRTSRRGFAVNFMAEAADSANRQLYRTTPERWARFCRDELGCSVETLTGYGLREFTLVATRIEAIAVTFVSSPRHRVRRASRAVRRAGPAPPSGTVRLPDQALRDAAATVISPEGHADDDRLHAAFRLLRETAPVHWVECAGIRPFWAVTRYEDVVAVERRDAKFLAAPRSVLSGEAVEAGLQQVSGKPQVLRSLTNMDAPDHTAYRAVTQPRFNPPALAGIEGWLADEAARAVDAMADRDGPFDFAAEIAAPFSLRVLGRLLGVPEADQPLLLKLSRGLVGAEDPARRMAEPPTEAIRLAMLGFRDYFDALADDRQRCPRDDVATAIATATVHGAPIPHYERVSYYAVVTTAGHDTTAFSIAGGLHALLEHPDELARLRRDPDLLNSAVEEMLRWTSPVRHFMRTAIEDTEIGGTLVRAGQSVAVFFVSANRDETVFADAARFRIERSPNPHIAFGWGAHFCLGHHLARMELRAFFREFLRRIDRVEAAGTAQRARAVFLTGVSSLPVRCRLLTSPRCRPAPER